MKKHYITAEQLLSDSIQLALNVLDSGFEPDLIVGIWRGGAPVGIAVQEIFEFLGVETDHISIRTASYSTKEIDKQVDEVRVYGLAYLEENYTGDHGVLLVDDVFDSGRSLNTVINRLKEIFGQDLPDYKIATPYYKPSRNNTNLVPDYYIHATSDWLVFPHELVGLSHEELLTQKPGIDAVRERLANVKKPR